MVVLLRKTFWQARFYGKFLVGVCFLFLVIGCDSNGSKIDPQTASADSARLSAVTKIFFVGKTHFVRHCEMCHAKPTSGKTDQIIFERLFERLPPPPEGYLVKFLQDSKALRAAGNQHALRTKEMWRSGYEHNFQGSLSSKDLEELITYLKTVCNH